MERDAALGERERLVVLMPHQRDVRLVVHDAGEHVVGLNGHREPFALTQGGRGFVVAARLREQHGRQRVHEREMAAIAGGVQRGGGFGQVVADDAGVADLLVAERQLVMGEADGARVVRELGVLQRARMQRDGARLLAAREGDPAVQAPQRRELRVGDRLAHRVGRPAERRGGLARSSCSSQASASAARTASSSSRVSAPERSSGGSSCAASAPRPRSSAAFARPSVDCVVPVATEDTKYTGQSEPIEEVRRKFLYCAI